MNKKSKVAVAGVAAVALVGGTLAYWSSSSTINNPFSTKSYEGETVENFNPADGGDWKPGGTVDKQVKVNNTGDYPLYVRVKFEEKWSNLDSNVLESTKANNAVVTSSAVLQESATDGLVAADGTVVKKNLAENWEENWIYSAADGYYYFKKAVQPNGSTENLLESVTLDQSTDMGLYTDYVTVTVNPEGNGDDDIQTFEGTDIRVVTEQMQDGSTAVVIQKVTVNGDGAENVQELYRTTEPDDEITQSVKKTLAPGYGGYADADYVLTITTEMCQENENDAPANWTIPTAPGV